MINLRVHTEYSFRMAYGKIQDIIKNCKEDVIAITDKYTTFGHIPFWKLCKKNNKKAILGVELSFVENNTLKVKQQTGHAVLLAINNKGLEKIYELSTEASANKYFIPRNNFESLLHIPEKDIVIIALDECLIPYLKGRGNTYAGISPMTNLITYRKLREYFPPVAISDNNFDIPEHESLYQIIMGDKNFESRVEKSWLLSKDEWKSEIYWMTTEEKEKSFLSIEEITGKIEDINFEQANLPKIEGNLRELCEEGFKLRKIDPNNKEYRDRLEYELDIIKKKNFEEYFLIVKDLVDFAKQKMFVGPGRGSAAGSLVCYLLFITEIDPLKFDLIFQRFIDINRTDMPDIDVDFSDVKRDLCFKYLSEKYGKDKVARLGTISKYKPDSILLEFNKILPLDSKLLEKFKNNMLDFGPVGELSDKRLQETMRLTGAGKAIVESCPTIKTIADIEGHNRHYGQHAAGVIIADKPLIHYGSLDAINDSLQLDKYDSEAVNLLKIDCLGLRTLSVFEECLKLIKKDINWLLEQSLEDPKVFDILNKGKFSGIFQFEGATLQNLTNKACITDFEDISHLTALGRPGPLRSGGAANYLGEGKNLKGCEEILKDTKGVIVYQEQIMDIGRLIGKMSWEDVSKLRKAVSKSLGKEVMDSFYAKFEPGALENGLTKEEAREIWNDILDAGAYAFNKAHSVSYALVSYWCMLLKAYFPLEFALATLRNSKGEEQTMTIIMELIAENYEIVLFDKDKSQEDWELINGILYGGFVNIKGCGITKAKNLIKKRKNSEDLTPGEIKLMFKPETPYDLIFKAKELAKEYIFENWKKYFLEKPLTIKNILLEEPEEPSFLCYIFDTEEKNNSKGKPFYRLTLCDGTSMLHGILTGTEYINFAKIIEKEKFYLAKGSFQASSGFVFIKKMKKLN